MATLKRIVSHVATGLLLATSVASAPSPQVSVSPNPSVTVPTSSAGPSAEPSASVDLAAEFVSQLISNATQTEEQLLASTQKRGLFCDADSSLVVDLGYARYQGYTNTSSGLNIWKGIRYAAAPVGNLRWKAPRLPSIEAGRPIHAANSFGNICPQSLPAVPNAFFIPGNEDCLFLNVWAPANARNLPVLVWIHGGGYGLGDGTQDMTDIINANNNGFVVVSIQYRLGAFGFLSSDEVRRKGVVNAGILDQAFALAWVKLFICQFGGNPLSVTISGESAGGGSVMYHDIAIDGNLDSLLFDKSIAASPYLPFQYDYDAAFPTSTYYAFSQAAGCPSSGNVFSCLVGKDTNTLQQANYAVTQAQPYGYWAFYPVTDNVYITDRAIKQLNAKKVNGKKLLVGNNANEGPLFVPPNITTETDLRGWLSVEFPNLSTAQINSILAANPNNLPTNPSGPHFETNGISTGYATAVNVSQSANGQQQRGNNIYAEAVFVCPSYWMATAYSSGSDAAYHYQYSVPFASHGADVAGYFGPTPQYMGDDFALAFRRIWGNFVTTGNPSISNAIANGASSPNPSAANPASAWPTWNPSSPKLLNLNQTGGTPYSMVTTWGATVTEFEQPGLRNAFTLAAADTWEGGRGARCAVYNSLGPSIPA
ncbi:acetylcholinesterase [Echria macrotheca]|uniref:Carboxylic ester hydrolase n=1 Tax=Echria macrotheca TaxID=438768 RepID=A0AAJ0BES2_9PEZI|nr:acetylcholinesterase [Echria macrotheca]